MDRVIVKCKAKENKEVKYKGRASIEGMKDGKLIIGCYGWREASTEELIESCRDCEIHVSNLEEI